ncbi:MAG: histidine phosphatase family protein [Chlamydiales bacterium]|nr:histidine phosphatase family protein [Chlamydiales bacterium]
MRKGFYFLRHGQTDHNAKGILAGAETDVPLNQVGIQQAQKVKTVIHQLPIEMVCYSPLIRAKQTMKIVAADLDLHYIQVQELKECETAVWLKMNRRGEHLESELVQTFFNQVKYGLSQVLSFGKSILVVSHGGVHWALCHLLGIQDHDYMIENCNLVHFQPVGHTEWIAEKINDEM